MKKAKTSRKTTVFVKMGGSFITNKSVADSLDGERIAAAARMLRKALDKAEKGGREISLVLGHGAGSYGHMDAVRFNAMEGVHLKHGWEGLYRIRDSMTLMNLHFVRHCREGGLNPVTVSPFAVAQAEDGAISRFDVHNIRSLLADGQIPLVHGDIIHDSKRGFTIASTEAILGALSKQIRFDRIVMLSDTEGVLGDDGTTIGSIDGGNIREIARQLGGSGAPDVTGGMRRKVETLYELVRSKRAGEARITRAVEEPERLLEAVLGTGGGGTVLKP